jgi:transcriptional regulator with XRE-family HTH domain
MPKQTYVPTEADRLTGQNVRALRRLAGETLQQTIDRSGVGISQSSLSNIENGKRSLSLPDATKLAAHWNTTAEKIIIKPVMDVHPSGRIPYKTGEYPTAVATEQEWLGNDKPPTPLFAVPDRPTGSASGDVVGTDPRMMLIDLDAPLTLDEYREQVWIPYLEARYSADQEAS